MRPTDLQEEFTALVNQQQAMLYKLCQLYCFSLQDRQDLFQEIVIQAWKSYPGFRGDSKFSTWLYRIALHTAISDLRRKKKYARVIVPSFLGHTPVEIPVAQGEEQQLQQLYAAISQLTEVEKAIVALYLDDKSYHEMEEILGINENNLRVKMNRIKEKIRKLTKEAEHGIGQF